MESFERDAVKVALMFGGDLGDSERIFDRAAEKLRENGFEVLRRSSIYRSAPVDCVPGTPDFADQALAGLWHGSARELLALCQKLEREAGRPEKHSSREARTLDCDIILFGDAVSCDPALTLPHPRARMRRFVLEPLFEIVPDWRFPDSGSTVSDEFGRIAALK